MDGETLTERLSEVVAPPNLNIIEEAPRILSSVQIQTIATSAWNEEVHVINSDILSYSNEKLGFLGLHKCLKITVRKKQTGELETKTFFVKCIPPNNAILSKCLEELGVFDQEIAFYSQVVPLLEYEYKGEQWFPKCYLISNEMIVTEDLRMKNFSNRGKLLTKEEVISALSTIARMHAASILAEKRVGKPLNKISPVSFKLNSYYNEGPRTAWFQTGVSLSIYLAEYLGLDSSKVKYACEAWLRCIEPSKSKQNVITHSDLWSNNIMFDNSSPLKSVIVDYQMSRYCPLAQDVIVFLHLCTNRTFRKSYQVDVVKHYYSVLIETLRLHDSNLAVPSWTEISTGIEEQTPCAVSIAAMYFPSVLLDGKQCVSLLGDPKKYSKFMYIDRRSVVLQLLKLDKEYADRLLEAITELVEVSQKLDQYPTPV